MSSSRTPGTNTSTDKSVGLRRFNAGSFGGPKALEILGFYSMNSDHIFTNDLSQLGYLKLPLNLNVHYDLKINSDSIIRRKVPMNELKLNSLLKWIISHQEIFYKATRKRNLNDIITYRGLLSKVMCSPYEKNEGWIICATRFQGRIYLCKYDTPEKLKYEERRTSKEIEMGDWGYVFEQHLVSEHPRKPPNMDKPNNQNEEFNCVFQTCFGCYNLLFGAEMDGVKLRDGEANVTQIGEDAKKLKEMLEQGNAEFVELKTSFDPKNTHSWEWKKICRFKSLKWWAQSIWCNIRDIVCGYRNNEGIVKRLKIFSVDTLPQLGLGHWNKYVCLQYLHNFLNLVVNEVSSGDDKLLWMFTWDPNNPDSIKVKLCANDSPYFFLHDEFTNEMTSHKKSKAENSEASGGSSSSKRARGMQI